MKKAFIAIVLVLTLSSAFAQYTTENFAKSPIPVCTDNEVNFTNVTALTIGSIGSSDVNLISAIVKPIDPQNSKEFSFTFWTRKLDEKSLAPGAQTTTFAFTASPDTDYAHGYFFYFTIEADSNNITQLYVNQIKMSDQTRLPKFALTTNTNSSIKPQLVAYYVSENIVHLYYIAASRAVNVTSFTPGELTSGKSFIITSNYDGNLAIAGGDALKSSQTLAVWNEGDTLKEAIIDGKEGTIILTANPVGGYNKTVHACYPYVTDKKLYGTICRGVTNGNQVSYLVRTNSSTLLPLFTANLSDTTEALHFPHGDHYGFIYINNSRPDVQVLTYEIWDLETLTTYKKRTQFLTYNPINSTQQLYKAPHGGVYVLLYNNRKQANGTLTSVQVGLLLESVHVEQPINNLPVNSSYFAEPSEPFLRRIGRRFNVLNEIKKNLNRLFTN